MSMLLSNLGSSSSKHPECIALNPDPWFHALNAKAAKNLIADPLLPAPST